MVLRLISCNIIKRYNQALLILTTVTSVSCTFILAIIIPVFKCVKLTAWFYKFSLNYWYPSICNGSISLVISSFLTNFPTYILPKCLRIPWLNTKWKSYYHFQIILFYEIAILVMISPANAGFIQYPSFQYCTNICIYFADKALEQIGKLVLCHPIQLKLEQLLSVFYCYFISIHDCPVWISLFCIVLLRFAAI